MFKRRRAHAKLAIPLAALLLMGLTACVNDLPQAASTGSGGSTSEPEPGATNTADPSDVNDGDGENLPATPTTCLLGSWVVDNAHLGSIFTAAVRESAPGAVVGIPTGEVVVDFADDGTYRVSYNSWTVRTTVEGVSIDVVRDGVDRGVYQADDDGALQQQDTQMGSEVVMIMPGVQELRETGKPAATSGTFTCDKDSLSIMTQGETGVMHRR